MSSISVAQVTSTTDQKTADPSWWEGVPVMFRKDPSYFRNIDKADLILQVDEARSAMSQHDVKLTSKKNAEAMKVKPPSERKYPLPKITGPVCRIRWPSLHATGDCGSVWTNGGGVPGQVLAKAHFSVAFYEGNVPDDLKQKFPAIEREQKAFFDFLAEVGNIIIEMMWDNKELRKTEREATEENTLGILDGDRTKLASPEIQARLKKQFFDKANQTPKGKKPFVRQPDEYYKGRWVPMKKAICGDLDPKKKQRWEKTEDSKHYINQLLDSGKEYHPPCILKPDGSVWDLGKNEKQILESNDLCIPSLFPKVYDAKDYGIRALYCSLQIVRAAREDEADSSGVDYSAMADEDFSETSFMNRKRKKTTEESGENKKQKSESAPSPVQEEKGFSLGAAEAFERAAAEAANQ
jgi:hypothetical protein